MPPDFIALAASLRWYSSAASLPIIGTYFRAVWRTAFTNAVLLAPLKVVAIPLLNLVGIINLLSSAAKISAKFPLAFASLSISFTISFARSLLKFVFCKASFSSLPFKISLTLNVPVLPSAPSKSSFIAASSNFCACSGLSFEINLS